jgi:long-chain acyl-CoA synthetase
MPPSNVQAGFIIMDTIVTLIERSCRQFSDRTALLQKREGSWQATSYGTLSSASDRIAAGLSEHGLRPGERAALLAASSPIWLMVYLGILKAGGVVVPIDKDLKEIEVCHILAHSEARIVLVDDDHLAMVLGMLNDLPQLALVVRSDAPDDTPKVPSGRYHCRGLSLSEFLKERAYTPLPLQPHDTALILYTSGTTGRSKGATLSHANIVSNIHGTAAHLGVDQSVHTLSFLPINHVFEQVCGVLIPLSLGGKVSFCESLKKLGENLAEVKPTFFVGVPAVYRMILGRVNKNLAESRVTRLLSAIPLARNLVHFRVRGKLGNGTVFISGGAALDPAIIRGFASFGVTLLQGYGITETSPVIAAESPAVSRPGTVGRVLPGVEVSIDAPESGMVGEILVRGPNVMQGYFKDPQATRDAIVDGWYRTGDLGRLDADGFLFICGRVKSLIVTPNGKNVYPEEVESEILKSPYVAEVVVYAGKSGPLQEEIRAVLYPNREALEEYAAHQGKQVPCGAELESLLRGEVSRACQQLAAYKRVMKISISDQEFPKTTTRKIKRFEVEASLQEP